MTCPHCAAGVADESRYCSMCGQPLDEGSSLRERRRVTVVFVDLADFSGLTHDADAEAVRDLANDVLGIVSRAIEMHDGYVATLRGDGLMAVFGAPRSHPDDPERAVRAASDALRGIEGLGATRQLPLVGRAGVNTGTVIAGAVGSGHAREYTVMGSAVNLAARLEEAAGPGEVWLGAETADAVRHRLPLEPVSDLVLAGFPHVRSAYRYALHTSRPQRDPFLSGPFLGRAHELATLRAARDEVMATQRSQERWLVGETGIGKTRLLLEAFGRENEAPRPTGERVTWLRTPVSGDIPWMDLARLVLGSAPGITSAPPNEGASHVADPDRDAAITGPRGLDHAAVAAALEELLPGESRWHRTILASLKMVDLEPWLRIDRRRVNRMAVAWRDLLVAWVQRQPGPWILIVDGGTTSLMLEDFLALLLEADAPILVLRSARQASVGTGPHRMHLPALDAEDALTLVSTIVGSAHQAAAELLVPQLDGVPGHLVELANALIRTGGVDGVSLDALLYARLDRLPADARTLLARAALTGERVWDGLLTELGGSANASLASTLVRENLLTPLPSSMIPGTREYRFQSEWLRHAALDLLPRTDRASVHVRIATWLERSAPFAFSDAIGAHFLAGGVEDAAFAHWLAAADIATYTLASEEVDARFERLLLLNVAPSDRLHVALAWGRACVHRGDRETAARALAHARTIASEEDATTNDVDAAATEQLERAIDGLERTRSEAPMRSSIRATS